MVTTSKTGSLKEVFNATGITFGGQSMEGVSADLRDEARLEEQAQEKKLQQLDDDFARLSPDENGEVSAPGRIGTGAAQNKAQEINQNQKKDKELTHFLSKLQQQRLEWDARMAWLEQWYREQAAEKIQQAKDLKQKIIDNTEEMIENSNFIGAVDKLLKAHEAGAPFDKEQLRKLLKDRGANIDDTTSLPILLRTAEGMIIEANEQNSLLDADNDTYEQEAEKFLEESRQNFKKADEVHAQKEAWKAEGLSDEEINQRSKELWDGASKKVKEGYGNQYGSVDADKEAVKNYSKEQESFDFFAEQPNASIEANKTEQSNSPNNSMPTPSGM